MAGVRGGAALHARPARLWHALVYAGLQCAAGDDECVHDAVGECSERFDIGKIFHAVQDMWDHPLFMFIFISSALSNNYTYISVFVPIFRLYTNKYEGTIIFCMSCFIHFYVFMYIVFIVALHISRYTG